MPVYPKCSDVTRPENHSSAAFSIEERKTTVNLSNWYRVPSTIRNTQGYSGVLFRNELLVRKTRPGLKWFTRQHLTSGLPLQFASAHTWSACVEKPVYGRGENQFEQYNLTFDVADEDDGVFELDYHTQYWNSFQRTEEEFAGVGISHPTKRVTFSVVLPFAPDAAQLAFKRSETGSNDDHRTETNASYQIDGKVVTWDIGQPDVGWMYWIYWKWPN